MKIKMAFVLFGICFAQVFSYASADDVIHLKVGFVQKITCKGRLYISAVGNENLVRLEALPKELGCGVVLKPIGGVGVTNMILETSSESKTQQIVVLK